jgi:hypothetical protein
MSDQQGYSGQWNPNDDTSDFNKTQFLVYQTLGLISTATLVQVKAVTNAGEVSPVGAVDVLPLVNMLDGVGNSFPHGTLYKLPYFRLQGGANAVIIDPQVNDLGIAIFADRDISSVKANKAAANPGSRRRFSMADGLYIGGFLNVVPNQYVRFNADGMRLIDKNGNKIEMTVSGIKLTDLSGNIINMTSSGVAITGNLSDNGVNVGSTHVHAGVTAGVSNTAVPH